VLKFVCIWFRQSIKTTHTYFSLLIAVFLFWGCSAYSGEADNAVENIEDRIIANPGRGLWQHRDNKPVQFQLIDTFDLSELSGTLGPGVYRQGDKMSMYLTGMKKFNK